MQIVTRKEAKESGLIRYFTGKSCIHGHTCERKTTTKRCVQCNRDRVKRWRKVNPDKYAGQRQRNHKSISESTKRSKLKKPAKYKALRQAWIEKNKYRYYASIAAAKKKNPEKYKAVRRAWENRVEVKAKRRQWELKNKEVLRSKRRVWEEKNREYINARHRQWSASNKEKVRQNTRVQQARRRSSKGKFSNEDISAILKSQKGKCAYFQFCGTKFSCDGGYEIDHILAVSKGGTSDPNNIQILCPTCNRRKSAKDAVMFSRSNGLLL